MSHIDEMEFMDIDGPEFLSDVNNQIADIRANYTVRNDGVSSDIFDHAHRISFDPHSGLEAYNEICVLDTNFLISKLGYLDTVLTLAEQRPGSVVVLLPWVVIKELDGLKSSRNGGDLGSESEIGGRARKAMRFIELRLREKSISLRGQKMNEILDPAMSSGQSIKGDDRILDCCMYFQQMTGKRVTLLSNDRNLCIKVMVHEIGSISAESVPKMESLLNRIGGIQEKRSTQSIHSIPPQSRKSHQQKQKNWTQQQQQRIPNQHHTEDYVMEVDEFYPNHNNHSHNNDEDYDMMIDDDEIYSIKPAAQPSSPKLKGTSDSMWANAPSDNYGRRHRKSFKEPAYLDNDPTLVAPKKPPQNLTYSNSNYKPISKDVSWTSIYSPR